MYQGAAGDSPCPQQDGEWSGRHLLQARGISTGPSKPALASISTTSSKQQDPFQAEHTGSGGGGGAVGIQAGAAGSVTGVGAAVPSLSGNALGSSNPFSSPAGGGAGAAAIGSSGEHALGLFEAKTATTHEAQVRQKYLQPATRRLSRTDPK